uniref:Glycosyltransferase family 92 protein n=1 Tax=Panagrolaimus davidi TaxID=227884 RepID=A0A914PEH3_9BILA
MFRFPTVFFGSVFAACLLLFIGLTDRTNDGGSPNVLSFDVDIPSLLHNNKKKSISPKTEEDAPKVITWNRNNSTDKFCVWFNFTKATKESDFRSISLCTHGSIGYSKFVFDHAQNWDDRISVALLVDSAGFNALKTYLKLHKCMENTTEKVSTHLVWKPENETCSTFFILDALEEPLNATDFIDNCNVDDHIDAGLFNHTTADLYYPNTLRNVAREGAGTELHLIADIENHFSFNASEILLEATKDVDKKSKIAVVVRRFEYNTSFDEPRTVKELYDLCRMHEAYQFHRFFYAIGHSVPGLPHWFRYSLNGSTTPTLFRINYRSSIWEPQLIVHASAPHHFEGFSMKRDQCALPYELCRAGYSFTVASHAFSFHKGIKINSSSKYSRFTIAKIARKTGNVFRQYLDAKYGIERIKTCKKW